jgi:hypothetical protein
MVAVDSTAYRRLQVVPVNIVTYNVFSGEGRGPNIFGTEPWWYYILNLALYFNIAVVAACASIPLMVFYFILLSRSDIFQGDYTIFITQRITETHFEAESHSGHDLLMVRNLHSPTP